MPDDLEALIARVGQMDRASKQQIFEAIKDDIAVHRLEEHFGISAQIICETIYRAGDLTQRGIRGMIAETVFCTDIAPHISGWGYEEAGPELPYDAVLFNGNRRVRIQVKLQRKELGVPLMRSKVRRGPKDFYIVEVQRTRTGERKGEKTRPYRFGQFDLLAVCMQPSTTDWRKFLYIPMSCLLPKKGLPDEVATYQFVPPYPAAGDPEWTNDIEEALTRVEL